MDISLAVLRSTYDASGTSREIIMGSHMEYQVQGLQGTLDIGLQITLEDSGLMEISNGFPLRVLHHFSGACVHLSTVIFEQDN